MEFRDSQLYLLANYPFALNHDSPQGQGLVAWWPLHDLAGRTVECMIRSGNRGTIGGATINVVRPATVEGAPGISFSDGANYIATGFTDALNDFTATCWFRPFGNNFFGRVIDKDETNGFNIVRAGGSADEFRGRIRGTDIAITTVTNTYPWFAAVRRSGTEGAFIINAGQMKATATVSSTATDTTAFAMGGTSGGGNQSFVDLRDVRVYNRALSDHELWQIYDPGTRYELFYPLGLKNYSIPTGAAGGGGGGSRNQVIVIG